MLPAPSSSLARFLASRAARIQEWIEQHPWQAWFLTGLIVLAFVGIEVSTWPLRDFPGATWHYTPRGDDIELAQAAAAKAGWRELAGYWFGRTIQGHGYYRPLTSWLFVGEYHLWGTDDRTWAWLNIALHLGVIAMLLWAAWAILEGSQTRRLVTGAGAALLLGAPGFADYRLEKWVLSWWPCQSEHLSLLAALWLLGAVAQYSRTGAKQWGVQAIAAFAVAVFFKEMGYVAGLGACLLLVRCPRSRALLAALGVEGVLLFTLRWAALQHAGGVANAPPTGRQGGVVWYSLLEERELLSQAFPQAAALAVGVIGALLAPRLVRKRVWTLGELLALGGVTYAVSAAVTIGLPWEGLFQSSLRMVLLWGWRGAVLAGLGVAARQWPVPGLLGIYLLSVLAVSGFPPTFGWYQYWGATFGSLLASIGLVALCLLAGRHLVKTPTKTLISAGSLASSRQ